MIYHILYIYNIVCVSEQTDYIAKSTNGTCWVPPIGMVYNGTYESKMDDDLGVALFQETYTKNVRKTPLTTNNF